MAERPKLYFHAMVNSRWFCTVGFPSLRNLIGAAIVRTCCSGCSSEQKRAAMILANVRWLGEGGRDSVCNLLIPLAPPEP